MISILGAGAIGQLIAHKLTEASVDCQLIVRPDTVYASDSWSLIEQESQTYHEISSITASNCDELRQLWVCVKSHQLKSALESIAHAITNQTIIVLFQNGMGHEKVAHQFIQSEQLFFASNTHGVFKKEPQTIEYAGAGNITFGHLTQEQKPEWLTDAILEPLNATWKADIETILWQKLFINAVVNPLSAIYQCLNGELLDADKKPRVLSLINENQRLAEALKLDSIDVKDATLKVIKATAANQSSMLQDVKRLKTTEIESINGYLLDIAAQKNVAVPHHWHLWSDFHIAYPPREAQRLEKAQELDSLSYRVTQEHGTEPPFSGSFNLHSDAGRYHCVCCDSPLFKDDAKFDSGCGWPSFDRAQDNKAVAYRNDTSHGMNRTEILCAQCGSHLGHVFEDGPTETGQRFCVNSVSLHFEKETS